MEVEAPEDGVLAKIIVRGPLTQGASGLEECPSELGDCDRR